METKQITLAKKLEDLAFILGFDKDVEYALHELCHVVTLEDETLIDPVGLEDNVGRAVHKLSHWKSDWNEILTIACQLVVFEEPSLSAYRDSAYNIAGNAMFYEMGLREVEAHALRHVKTQATQHRAEEAKNLIHRTWERYSQGEESRGD